MNTRRYLPANLAGLALFVLLTQAQAKAESTTSTKKSEPHARAEGNRRARRYVAKRQRRALAKARRNVASRQRDVSMVRGSMRQRAMVYEPVIAAAARKYGVDPRALWTLAYLETRFRSNQVSPKGARGLMQFIPSTAARFNLTNPFDAAQSIDAAARYVAELTRQFNGRLDLVLAAYNSGETTVDCYLNGRTVRKPNGGFINPRGAKTGGLPPYAETQSYVRRGLLVFNTVTSVNVFSPELIASIRTLQSPALPISTGEQLAVNRELVELTGGMNKPAVLVSANVAKPIIPASNPAAFDMVFYDIHSGARYLVASGQIVKPLESVSDEKVEKAESGHTKSVYFGSREEK